jgi:hypothetical protein
MQPAGLCPCHFRGHDLPQSGQKQLVMDLPLSAILTISFGVPCVTLKLALGTTKLLE